MQTQKVKILIDDPAPKAITRFKKGDIATVVHHQKRLTKKVSHHYLVKLPYRSYCGEGEDKRGLSTQSLFMSHEVQPIPSAFE